MSTGETVERMRDHWWWRPGWRVGRSFYTWHITFGNQPAVHQVADGYAPALDGVPTLDLIPPLWLHLTMQGVGFTDEVSRADADRIVGAVRAGCAVLAPFTVTLGPARVDAEALKLPVRPAEPVARLRGAIRSAIAKVWGDHNVPESADGFRPHVSLAYSNAAGPSDLIARRLAAHPIISAEITVNHVSLIDLNRDHRTYEWTEVATATLGTVR